MGSIKCLYILDFYALCNGTSLPLFLCTALSNRGVNIAFFGDDPTLQSNTLDNADLDSRNRKHVGCPRDMAVWACVTKYKKKCIAHNFLFV